VGDLEEILAKESEVVKRIYSWHESKRHGSSRGYLGGSLIGHDCERYLWFSFRGAANPVFDGRMLRLFQTGDLEESRFVAELRGIGLTVLEADETGQQFRVEALGGHFAGHMDGVAVGVPTAEKTWHLLEFKTHNSKNFAKLFNGGVEKNFKKHHDQMQSYMGLGGLKRGLYLAKNKDTDALFAERVRFDRAKFDVIMAKAERVITSASAPERIASRPDDWRCKFCDAHALCWNTGAAEVAVPIPRKTCKTCCHSSPDVGKEGAKWVCQQFWTELDSPDVGEDCPEHLLLPDFIAFAVAADANEHDGWIEYANQDGSVWRQGRHRGQWTTEDLMSGRGPLDGPKMLAEPDGDRDLLKMWGWPAYDLLWSGEAEALKAGLAGIGWPAPTLAALEPVRGFLATWVNAVEYTLGGSSYLIASYTEEGESAIWRNPETYIEETDIPY